MRKLDAESMAALPGPGEVDFLCGGPPCQGYSGMNRFNKGDLLDLPILCHSCSLCRWSMSTPLSPLRFSIPLHRCGKVL